MNALRYAPFALRGLRRKGPPLHLTLFVTGRCNLRCRHCFHWKEVAEGAPGPRLEEVRKLADSCAAMGPLLWTSFGGGEPFLRKDLPDLAHAFARHGLRHLAIPTNGLVEERQHDAIARILAENPELYLSVAVSFDGPPEIHDSIRQVSGGHARSMASVRALKRQQAQLADQAAGKGRFGVGILVTITAENQHAISAHLRELVAQLEPDNATINLARGTAMEPHLLAVDPDRYAELVRTKRALNAEGRLPYFDFPLASVAAARDRLMYDHVERLARGDRSRHLPCTAGSLSLVVFENGSVQPCEILGREFGNLNTVDWDLRALWSAPAAEALRREIAATRCACTWECAAADNVLFQPGLWPKLARSALAPS